MDELNIGARESFKYLLHCLRFNPAFSFVRACACVNVFACLYVRVSLCVGGRTSEVKKGQNGGK